MIHPACVARSCGPFPLLRCLPLFLPAVFFCLRQVTKALLKAGAQVDLRTRDGTPLEVVLQAASPDPALVRALVQAGADLGCRGWCRTADRVRVCAYSHVSSSLHHVFHQEILRI